jgi:hypothetical protein
MRASDVDRERVATQLRDHAAAGRLTVDELSERLDASLAARTVGELEPLLADLPQPQPRRSLALTRLVPVPMFAIAALLVAIWALTGTHHHGGFWPGWALLGIWWFGFGPMRRRRWAHSRRGAL